MHVAEPVAMPHVSPGQGPLLDWGDLAQADDDSRHHRSLPMLKIHARQRQFDFLSGSFSREQHYISLMGAIGRRSVRRLPISRRNSAFHGCRSRLLSPESVE